VEAFSTTPAGISRYTHDFMVIGLITKFPGSSWM